jgi:hypothetical protein
MATVSLPLAVWGEGYAQFFPRWVEAANQLGKKPIEIVLVTDEANRYLSEVVESQIPIKHHYLKAADYRLWDYAIRQCQGDWIGICNVDDVWLANGLDQIDEAEAEGCNLLVDSLIVRGTEHVWSGYWDANTIPERFTLVGAEPMRKDLYIAAGGFDYRYQFPDWALAVHMVHKSLAKPFRAKTHRVYFDPGFDRVTMSGQQQNPSLKAAGTAQVHDLSRSLGLL